MDEAVLDLLQFYQKEIATPEGGTALAALGIDNPEVIEHFGLGWCSGKAFEVASKEQRQLLRKLGLAYNRCGTERFRNAIVIPVYDQNNELVDLCGIKSYDNKANARVYIRWQKPTRGLIGSQALHVYPDIILCAKPYLALHVRQCGYPNVVSLRDHNELKNHLPLFQSHSIQRVYIAGQKYRTTMKNLLEKNGYQVTILKFDKTETVVSKTALAVVGKAQASPNAHNVTLVSRDGNRLHFAVGKISFRVESHASVGLGMRVRIKVESAGTSFLDKLDLASASARQKFSRPCATRLSTTAKEIEDHLMSIADAIDKLELEAAQEQTRTKRTLTAAEHKAAIKLLKEKDVLELQADALGKYFHFIDEEANKRLVLLVAASRLLSKPLGAIIRGQAGSGKSALMQAVCRVLPVSEVLNLSRLTPQAFYFMPKEDLHHKLMVVDEYDGLENSEYALRTVMSNQTLSLAITVREGGRVPVTKQIEIPATLAILVSTTGIVNVENLSRFIELRMDVSQKQTERVMHALAGESTQVLSQSGKEAVQALQNAASLLRPCVVSIPYARRLVYSSGSVLARRQFAQVVGLISAHAALHQYQRETHEDNGNLTVIADKDDYRRVHPLLSSVIDHFEEGLSPAALQLIETLEKKKAKVCTRKDVIEWLGWSYSKSNRTMDELVKIDLLVPDRNTNGVQRSYEVASYYRMERGISQILPPKML